MSVSRALDPVVIPFTWKLSLASTDVTLATGNPAFPPDAVEILGLYTSFVCRDLNLKWAGDENAILYQVACPLGFIVPFKAGIKPKGTELPVLTAQTAAAQQNLTITFLLRLES